MLVAIIVSPIFDKEVAIVGEAVSDDALLREAHFLIGFDSMALESCLCAC